jgi:hypothetical protein
MTDTIVEVMVEVLCVLAIATKEIKQNRASELVTVIYQISRLNFLQKGF